MGRARVIVVGAGPGGLAATRYLAGSRQVQVTLVQRAGEATFLPGILPVLLGLRPAAAYRHALASASVQVVPGEVVGLAAGRVRLADGTALTADAIIAAPGLVTDAAAIPAGARSFAVWELAQAAAAHQALQTFTTGRLVIAISGLPYRCPPAPYGLALALQAQFQERGRAVEVVLTTPEARPLQTLGERVPRFLEQLASAGNVVLQTGFQVDPAACRDGLLAATDGRRISYDLGLFIPPHRRPAFLAELAGNGPLVPVDTHQRTPLDRTWVIGDVAATPLPRAIGAAEAQGQTAAEDALATLDLRPPAAPTTPALSCYVWTSPAQAAHIQVRFPRGLPPAGAPDIALEPPSAALLAAALEAGAEWARLEL
jgi:sulfide:quinone oxidoreductase